MRVAIVVSVAVMIHAASLLIPDVQGGGGLAWYHYLFFLPLSAVLMGNAHDPNVAVYYIVWTLQCLAIGVLVDAVVARIRRRRKP